MFFFLKISQIFFEVFNLHANFLLENKQAFEKILLKKKEKEEKSASKKKTSWKPSYLNLNFNDYTQDLKSKFSESLKQLFFEHKSELSSFSVKNSFKTELDLDNTAYDYLKTFFGDFIFDFKPTTKDGEKDDKLFQITTQKAATFKAKSKKTLVAMVFFSKISTCEMCTNMFKSFGYRVGSLHSAKSQDERFYVVDQFKKREIQFLFTTDVGARGLDIPSVQFVINFDLPNTSKDYVHRVGRSARAGQTGTAFNLSLKSFFLSIFCHVLVHFSNFFVIFFKFFVHFSNFLLFFSNFQKFVQLKCLDLRKSNKKPNLKTSCFKITSLDLNSSKLSFLNQ